MKKLLLTLVGVICSLGMWADTAIITPANMSSQAAGTAGIDGTETTTAGNLWIGNGSALAKTVKIQITSNATKALTKQSTITYNSNTYDAFKNSNGAQMTVKVPEGYVATAVDFYVTANATDDATLSECDGVKCTDAVTSHTDGTKPTHITKTIGNKNQFTFTFSTKQVFFIAVVTYYSTAAPAFTKDLSDSYSCYTSKIQALSVTASNANSYQWYSCTDADKTGAKAIEGATSATYNFVSTTAGTYYVFCRATNQYSSESPVDSKVATLSVAEYTPTIAFTTDLSETYNCLTSHSLTLSVAADDALTYQWYTCTDAEGNGAAAIEGATSASYEFKADEKGTYYVFCRAINGKVSKDSKVAAITVTDPVKRSWDFTKGANYASAIKNDATNWVKNSSKDSNRYKNVLSLSSSELLCGSDAFEMTKGLKWTANAGNILIGITSSYKFMQSNGLTMIVPDVAQGDTILIGYSSVSGTQSVSGKISPAVSTTSSSATNVAETYATADGDLSLGFNGNTRIYSLTVKPFIPAKKGECKDPVATQNGINITAKAWNYVIKEGEADEVLTYSLDDADAVSVTSGSTITVKPGQKLVVNATKGSNTGKTEVAAPEFVKTETVTSIVKSEDLTGTSYTIPANDNAGPGSNGYAVRWRSAVSNKPYPMTINVTDGLAITKVVIKGKNNASDGDITLKSFTVDGGENLSGSEFVLFDKEKNEQVITFTGAAKNSIVLTFGNIQSEKAIQYNADVTIEWAFADEATEADNKVVFAYQVQNKTVTPKENCQNYVTFCDSKAWTVDREKVRIYVAEQPANGANTITLNYVDDEVTTINANTPVILRNLDEDATDINMTYSVSDQSTEAYKNNAIKVAETAGAVENAYVLGYTTAEGFGFYKYTAELAAGQVYVQAASAGAKLSIVFADDNATAVAGVAEANAAAKTVKAVVNGQLVIKTANGTFNAAGTQIK